MLYLDHRRHLVPDKWYGGTSQTFQKTHVKERCGGGGVSGMGCGLWKTKGQPCPHCETRPNRSQAKIAQAMHRVSDRNDKWGFRDPTPEKRPSSAAQLTQEIMNEYLYSGDGPKASLHRRSSAGSRDRLMVHTKERCGGGNVSGMGCGMWKTIGQTCPHCEARPNRMQAQAAQDRQEAVELGWDQACQPVPVDSSGTPMGSSRRSLHSQGFEEPATFSVVPGTPQALTHRKERCGGGSVGGMGCGMWKTKGQPCPWCEARPNREQAKLAQAMCPRVDLRALYGMGPLTMSRMHDQPKWVRDDMEKIMQGYVFTHEWQPPLDPPLANMGGQPPLLGSPDARMNKMHGDARFSPPGARLFPIGGTGWPAAVEIGVHPDGVQLYSPLRAPSDRPKSAISARSPQRSPLSSRVARAPQRSPSGLGRSPDAGLRVRGASPQASPVRPSGATEQEADMRMAVNSCSTDKPFLTAHICTAASDPRPYKDSYEYGGAVETDAEAEALETALIGAQ